MLGWFPNPLNWVVLDFKQTGLPLPRDWVIYLFFGGIQQFGLKIGFGQAEELKSVTILEFCELKLK